jgi:signal peptidase I
MDFAFWKKKEPRKPVSAARDWFNSVLFAAIAATLIRWTTVEAYVVPTPSMENTILVGDYLFVSKFHYGTRTTTTPLQIPLTHQKIWGTNIPSYLDWIELPSYRLPGISEVKRGDVVVFNVPPKSMNEGQEHPVQLKSNYVKRCVAVAGDRLQIIDKEIFVNGAALDHPENMKFRYMVTASDEITSRTLTRLELSKDDCFFLGRQDNQAIYSMFLTNKQSDHLSSLPFVSSITLQGKTNDGPEDDIFPSSTFSKWNGDAYGPLVIPKKGMAIDINDSTLAYYGETIRLYEHLDNVTIADGKLTIGGKAYESYSFTQDYYFMMGDNRHNSLDSRYWGFVPADHIVGKPLFIWLSLDYEADLLHKVRWDRMFTKIE